MNSERAPHASGLYAVQLLLHKTFIRHVLNDFCFLIICQIKDCKTQPNHSVAYMTKKHGSVHIQLYNILPYVGTEWFWISQCLWSANILRSWYL